MPTDFKAKLKEAREAEKLNKQLHKIKKSSAPSMNPWLGERKVKKQEEAPPADIRDFQLLPLQQQKITMLLDQHTAITIRQRQLKNQKKPITEDLKKLCKSNKIEGAFMAGGNRGVYYTNKRSTISADLLLAHGISAQVIKECTITKEIPAFKSGLPYGVSSAVEDDSDD